MNRREKRGTVVAEVLEDGAFARRDVVQRRHAAEARKAVRQVEREPAVAVTERFDTGPDDLAPGRQGVEI